MGFGELTETELFGSEDDFGEDDFNGAEGVFDDEELPVEEAVFDDEVFPADTNYPGDDILLAKLANEINRETSRMNESETMDYMEDRMAEFLPALAAAIPTIIQLAPKAINAISSLIKKDPPRQKAAPAAATTPVPTITNLPQVVSDNQTANDQGATGISSIPALRVFTDLIQSPKLLELLSGLMGGEKQSIKAKTGQKVNASNVLGIIASLAGALAGEAGKGSQESFFPEYAMSNEGNFLINPHDAQQEAELILDLIN